MKTPTATVEQEDKQEILFANEDEMCKTVVSATFYMDCTEGSKDLTVDDMLGRLAEAGAPRSLLACIEGLNPLLKEIRGQFIVAKSVPKNISDELIENIHEKIKALYQSNMENIQRYIEVKEGIPHVNIHRKVLLIDGLRGSSRDELVDILALSEAMRDAVLQEILVEAKTFMESEDGPEELHMDNDGTFVNASSHTAEWARLVGDLNQKFPHVNIGSADNGDGRRLEISFKK
jgi:hypothetical protein